MLKNNAVNFIANNLDLSKEQIELLNKLPEGCWLKCTKAFKVAEHKGYPIKVQKKGLLNNKPNPIVEFIHTYFFIHATRELTHSISINISI
jgi:hypothetical protein